MPKPDYYLGIGGGSHTWTTGATRYAGVRNKFFLMQDLNPATVKIQMEDILNGNAKQGIIPPLWDGKASERIAGILVEKFEK